MARRTPAQYDWSAVEFDERILRKHFTAPRRQKIAFVVAHHSTIVGKGTGSANDTMYQVWQSREASAHYGVDGDYVMQFVWDSNAAWAVGNTTGNHAGISIEHANATAGPRWTIAETTWKNGAKLVAHLHKVYKLGRPTSTNGGRGGTLRKHSAFASTACPGPFMDSIWSKYVAEAQRVYDSITKPAPKPQEPAVPAVFRIATYNVYGANYDIGKPTSWANRKAAVKAALIGAGGLKASIYCMQEVNTDAQRADILAMLGAPRWKVVKSSGRNDIFYDSKKHRLLSSSEYRLGSTGGQDRRLTQANFEHIATGVRYWVGNTHLSSSVGSTQEKAAASRTVEAKAIVELTKTKSRFVLCGDLNNTDEYDGSARTIIEAANRRWLRKATTVEDATYNQHSAFCQPTTGGKWLSDIALGSLVQASNAALHIAPWSASDHLPIVTTLTIA